MRLINFFVVVIAFVGSFPLQASLCCLDNIYIEAGGGFVTGLSRARDEFGVEAVSTSGNGIATNAQILPGGFAEAKIGYLCFPCLHFDVSYTFVTSRFNWQEISGTNSTFDFATTSVFNADLNSHIVLANAYLQLDQLCCDATPCWCVSPYLMGGVGAVWNDLFNIKQFVSPTTLSSVGLIRMPEPITSNFAARFGLGVLARFYCVAFNAALRATYINAIKTSNTGTSSTTIRNNWLGDFYVGVNYLF
jgi:hypothetical protein